MEAPQADQLGLGLDLDLIKGGLAKVAQDVRMDISGCFAAIPLAPLHRSAVPLPSEEGRLGRLCGGAAEPLYVPLTTKKNHDRCVPVMVFFCFYAQEVFLNRRL